MTDPQTYDTITSLDDLRSAVARRVIETFSLDLGELVGLHTQLEQDYVEDSTEDNPNAYSIRVGQEKAMDQLENREVTTTYKLTKVKAK